jgi:cell division protein FtsQ
MTRKTAQAKRRKQKKAPQFRLPVLPLGKLAVLPLAGAVIALCYQFSAGLLDQPIRSITIEGPFQRASALQIEESINTELAAGFFGANLKIMRKRIVALPWIDQANVARRWPGKLEISVTEQIPAAVWGDNGLLNTHGELFVTDARHVPAELPRLSGPDGQSAVVAARYLQIREKLIPLGLDVRQLQVDARGAWQMTLQNGIGIRLGRRDVEARTKLFLDVAASIISSRESEIEYVDMRYGNGFTVGWKNGFGSPGEDSAAGGQEMVAGRLAITGLTE